MNNLLKIMTLSFVMSGFIALPAYTSGTTEEAVPRHGEGDPPSKEWRDHLTKEQKREAKDALLADVRESNKNFHDLDFHDYLTEDQKREAIEAQKLVSLRYWQPSKKWRDYLDDPEGEPTEDQKEEAMDAQMDASNRYWYPERMAKSDARKKENIFKKAGRGLASGAKKAGNFVENKYKKAKKAHEKHIDDQKWERDRKKADKKRKKAAKAAEIAENTRQYKKDLDRDERSRDRALDLKYSD